MLGWSDEAIKEGIDKVMICVCVWVFVFSHLSNRRYTVCVLSEEPEKEGKVTGSLTWQKIYIRLEWKLSVSHSKVLNSLCGFIVPFVFACSVYTIRRCWSFHGNGKKNSYISYLLFIIEVCLRLQIKIKIQERWNQTLTICFYLKMTHRTNWRFKTQYFKFLHLRPNCS